MSPTPTAAPTTTPASPARLGPSAPTAAWFAEQRWYATHGEVPEPAPPLVTALAPDLAIAVVAVGDERYQLVTSDDRPDSLDDPATAHALAAAFVGAETATGSAGTVTFHRERSQDLSLDGPDRPLGGEQSNSSIVIGDRHILKVLRRLQPGPHPEVEMLGTLSARGSTAVPALAGWYEVHGAGIDATLGVLQEFVADGIDGWQLITRLRLDEPGRALPLLHDLGATLAGLHRLLGQPTDDADFAPAAGGRDLAPAIARGIVDATLDLARELGHEPSDVSRTALVHDLAVAAELAPHWADRLATGTLIRHHGDLHLGQTLHTATGWRIIDWEGEPARSLAERRAKHSPLRDVAGMLRSFAYAAGTGAGHAGWEHAARAAFLDGYLAAADPALLPRDARATVRLLNLFELEKVVYEVGYELAHRPDWLAIPAAGLHALVGRSAA